MKLKRVIVGAVLAAGVSAATLFGTGIGIASADPGWHCDNGRPCGDWQNNGWHPDDWQHRGIDDGRRDHQAFMWNGQQVQPMLAGDGQSWGFWFLGQWIPL